MDRRTLIRGSLAISALAAGAARAEPLHAPHEEAAPPWVGAAIIRGGKGYAHGSFGQIHYRDIGPEGQTPFLLIHQSPLTMVEFAGVQAALARQGRRSIAVDNPGFGLSDAPPNGVTIEQLADNMLPLIDHLGLRQVLVAGHHTGASIAAAFAARHPQRVDGVILHGVPLYTAAERAERLARPPADLALRPDGAQFSETFHAIYKVMGAQPAALPCATWATLGEVLAGPSTPTYEAVFAHDLAPDLRAIRSPCLIATDTNDVLHAHDLRALKIRPDFEYVEFSDGSSPAIMEAPARWAEMAFAFARRRRI